MTAPNSVSTMSMLQMIILQCLSLVLDADAERTEGGQINADHFRSDTMILATFDRDNDDVKMVSIPRDTRLILIR